MVTLPVALAAAALAAGAPASGDAGADAPLVRVADTSRELGTSYEVVLAVPPEDVLRAGEDLRAARARCRELERQLSEWDASSEISRVNRTAGREPVTISSSLARLLAGSAHVWRITRGAFDPTWRALAPLWDAAAARDAWPDAASIAAARAHVGWTLVTLDATTVRFATPEVRLGIAGVAKGWIIDSLFHLLRTRGHANVLVNVGGDLRVSGLDASGRANVFSVLDPLRPDRVAVAFALDEGAMATSGNYIRRRTIAGRTAGHILDPRTGEPAPFEGSVTVLTRDAAMADALATGLFVLGPAEGLALVRSLDGVDAVYVTPTGIESSIDSLSTPRR